MLSTENRNTLRNFCAQHSIIAAAYLFGSCSTGRDRQKSDIDLAFFVRKALDPMERIDMETTLSNLLGRDVDLIIFDQVSSLLQHQILKYGRLIYEADPSERVRQEVFARRAYLDSAFLYRKLNRKTLHGRQ
jgi:hypothetical protein